ncbi:MAG: YraN family protein [Lentisphaerae bacterium]|nr:YraN family protein [Lentisphaerota bacterium]
MADSHLETGEWGERCAEQYLRQAGFKILGRRVRFGPREELDLVARDGRVLVFVEVKARASEAFGRPAASVDRHKRDVLSRAAVHYLGALRFPKVNFRFDVVEVVGRPDGDPPTVRHIPNAFTLSPRYMLPG